MTRTRTRLAAAVPLAALAVALAATPVAAQDASVTAELINGLNNQLLIVAIPITILVEGILLYTIVKFRNADEAKPTRENRRLEITWTIATAIILLFVGVASYGVLANPNVTLPAEEANPADRPADAVTVQASAFQWGWNMSQTDRGLVDTQGGDTDLTDSTDPVIVIPVDTQVYFEITATDVLHGFHVPELGLKQDAIPDQTNTIKTTVTETGEYQGYCTEYCGVGHSQMYFTVVVVPQDDYESYVAAQQGGATDGSTANSTAANATVVAPTPA
jgi:cytochrome c oxidase subunit 2